MASPSLFSTLGARPALGRLLNGEDAAFGPDDVVPVVISHALWRRRFGSDPGIIGRAIDLNSVPRRVIGVLEEGFEFPRRETDVWYATEPNPASAGLSSFFYSAVARLRPGVTAAEAEADLNRLIPRLADAYPDASRELFGEGGLRAIVEPLKNAVVGELAAALWMLFGGVGFVLLIAGANVANLFMVRAEHRRLEVAIRVALGADGRAVARYFLTESALLCALGAAIGLGLAWAGVRLLVAFGPTNIPRLHEVGVDGRTVAFAAALALAAALLFAVLPFLRGARAELPATLGTSGRNTASRESQRAQRLLVASQVALALTLLVGSALLVQSLWKLRHVDPGFDPEHVLTVEIALPFTGYETFDAAAGFWDRLLERVRALPGVEAAGAASAVPLVRLPAYYDYAIQVEERPVGPGEAAPTATIRFVTPGYFDALRMPVLAGRTLRPGDPTDGTAPVLVSATLARRLFPDGAAVGRRVRRRGRDRDAWNTIAGVVGDVSNESVVGEPAAIYYIPVLDRPVDPGMIPGHLTLAIRTGLPPASLVPAVRRIVRELDPALPIANARTMRGIVDRSMARHGFAMLLLLVAAGAALFLGAVGIYGVISYTVTQRVREIGIRLALGARAADVRRMLLRQGAAVALAGLAAGTLAALWLTGFLDTLLYEVSPSDPATIAAMAALLLAVALLASWAPATRAARTDPMVTLRTE